MPRASTAKEPTRGMARAGGMMVRVESDMALGNGDRPKGFCIGRMIDSKDGLVPSNIKASDGVTTAEVRTACANPTKVKVGN